MRHFYESERSSAFLSGVDSAEVSLTLQQCNFFSLNRCHETFSPVVFVHWFDTSCFVSALCLLFKCHRKYDVFPSKEFKCCQKKKKTLTSKPSFNRYLALGEQKYYCNKISNQSYIRFFQT